tara:strand:- start:63222 stop:63839 length:618 start_codon:yes stop_codon:yes gene_type:complete
LGRNEFPQCLEAAELADRSFLSPDGQVRVFGPVVEPATRLLPACIADLVQCRPVGAKPTGHDDIGIAPPLHHFAQNAQCCLTVPALGDRGFQHFTFVISRTPEPVRLTFDFDECLVEMPSPVREFSTDQPPLADLCGKDRPEPISPEPHALMAQIAPPFVEQVLDVSKRQWEPDVQHHRKADHLRRRFEIAKWVLVHPTMSPTNR